MLYYLWEYIIKVFKMLLEYIHPMNASTTFYIHPMNVSLTLHFLLIWKNNINLKIRLLLFILKIIILL